MWNCPTYDKFYIGISQRLCSFFICTVLHHKLWFENRTALCYNKSNTRIPLFWQQVCLCRKGSCGAKILKISCAWTGGSGAVGFLTPTKKRAACYLFFRGIYVAFFGCKSECADLAKNRSGILMLRFGLLIRAGNRHGFRYGWGTKFSDCMEVRRLVCGRRFPQTIKARDWVVMRRLYWHKKGEFLSVRMRTKLCVAQNIKKRQRKREI